MGGTASTETPKRKWDDDGTDAVGRYLRRLALSTHVAESKDFRARRPEESHRMQNDVLAAFGQCSELPFVLFHLQTHPPEHWLRLYAPIIRCRLEPCGRGFVFLSWYLPKWNTLHSTVMYFDLKAKKQVFYDPLSAIDASTRQFLATHHLWEADDDPERQLVVVDADVPLLRSLQARYFGPGRAAEGPRAARPAGS